MAVIQIALEIPDDIYSRLPTGEYVRVGGVIRNQAGQIVALLDDARRIDDAGRALTNFATTLKNPKYALIGLGVVAVATAGTAYLVTRRTRAGQPELPASVASYSASLAAYLEAARHGALDAKIIDRLIADLDAVKAESDSGSITVAFLPEQWATLVGIVAGHTRTLAEANQLELSNLPESANAQGDAIVELRPYLEVQRELFSRTA